MNKKYYESQQLFNIPDDVYKKLDAKNTLQKRKKLKIINQWKIRKDMRNIIGDGIEELTGYNLSSVWHSITHQMADIYPYSIELPLQNPKKLYSGGWGYNNKKIKYSRTNLEEIRRIIKTYLRGGGIFFRKYLWMEFVRSNGSVLWI